MRSFFKHKLFATLRRFAIFLLVVWTVVSLVTLLMELVPGDPAVSVLGEQATPEQFEQYALGEIRGVGPMKIEKYGEQFLALLRAADETEAA